MNDADRIVLDAMKSFMSPTDYAFVVSRVTRNGGFRQTHDSETRKVIARAVDAMHKASFGGDRSAAGRYAAQVRWGRGSSMNSDTVSNRVENHGLKTEFPVVRAANGELMIEYTVDRFREPKAAERGIPTVQEFKRSIQTDLATVRQGLTREQDLAIDIGMDALETHMTKFQRGYDQSGRKYAFGLRGSGIRPTDTLISDEIMRISLGTTRWELVGMSPSVSGNPKKSAAMKRVMAKVRALTRSMEDLENPAV